jgi:hypothetical protein
MRTKILRWSTPKVTLARYDLRRSEQEFYYSSPMKIGEQQLNCYNKTNDMNQQQEVGCDSGACAI